MWIHVSACVYMCCLYDLISRHQRFTITEASDPSGLLSHMFTTVCFLSGVYYCCQEVMVAPVLSNALNRQAQTGESEAGLSAQAPKK